MNSFKNIPLFNKISKSIFLLFIGISYITYNQYKKLQYVDLSYFKTYESQYNSNIDKIKEHKEKLQYLLDLERKFSNRYINKRDIENLIVSLCDALQNLQLIDGYTIERIRYDNRYINVVHIDLRLYSQPDVKIVKNVLQYFFENVIDHDIIKLKSIDVDYQRNIVSVTLYK